MEIINTKGTITGRYLLKTVTNTGNKLYTVTLWQEIKSICFTLLRHSMRYTIKF